jgi:tetratricopeptide (TPR) repeat protein
MPDTRVEGRWTRPSKATLLLVLVALLSSLIPVVWADGPAAQHFQTGLAYERLGRFDEAYTELQLAFALDQDDVQKAVALGVVACRLDRLEVAQRALERSLSIDSSSIASYYHLALIYEKNGVTDRALDAWHRFLSLSQDDMLKMMAKKHIQYLESRVNE